MQVSLHSPREAELSRFVQYIPQPSLAGRNLDRYNIIILNDKMILLRMFVQYIPQPSLAGRIVDRYNIIIVNGKIILLKSFLGYKYETSLDTNK